ALLAQSSLMELAEREWQSLLSRTGLADMLNEDGALELYESERACQGSLPGVEDRHRFGKLFRYDARAEQEQLQPGLAERFQHATFLPGWKTVTDPRSLGHALWTYAERCGATFIPGAVMEVQEGNGVLTVRTNDGRAFSSSTVIIATGAWSRR